MLWDIASSDKIYPTLSYLMQTVWTSPMSIVLQESEWISNLMDEILVHFGLFCELYLLLGKS